MALGREEAQAVTFDLVFELHRDYVYRLAYALLGNAQDSEDVTQEVFLRVYKALPSYDPERATMRTWLTTMAVNASRTQRRRNLMRLFRRHTPAEDEEMPELVDPSLWAAPEDHAMQTEVRRTVRDILSKLGEDHRTVLVLHYYMDLPAPEIARVLNCPEGTVYSRLHYARRLVHAQLQRHQAYAPGEVGLA